MFLDINKALRKFQHILEDDEQCKQLFPRGTFIVAYKRGHKNLKEFIAPARVNTGMSVGPNYDRDTQGKCGSCGTSNRGRKKSLVSMHVKWSRRVVALKVTKQGRFIKSDKVVTVEVKI